jgi:3D (Asp-Asp-Asp) domain-containing protein
MASTVTLFNTYFLLARESDYSGPKDTPIYRTDGTVIALASRGFVNDLCVEGSGLLADGRVVNFSSGCSYGPTCLTGGQICYTVLDRTRYPWGKGHGTTPLVPLRSLAVDPHVIPFGSFVYLPRWKGVHIPAIDGIGGFVHDGCFRADDSGGWIVPRPGDPPGLSHIDIFAGTRTMHRALERIFPTRTVFEASIDPTSCAQAQTAMPGTASTSGGIPSGAVLIGAAVVGIGVWWAIRHDSVTVVRRWFQKVKTV